MREVESLRACLDYLFSCLALSLFFCSLCSLFSVLYVLFSLLELPLVTSIDERKMTRKRRERTKRKRERRAKERRERGERRRGESKLCSLFSVLWVSVFSLCSLPPTNLSSFLYGGICLSCLSVLPDLSLSLSFSLCS